MLQALPNRSKTGLVACFAVIGAIVLSLGCAPLQGPAGLQVPPILQMPQVDQVINTESVTVGPPSHDRVWRIELARLPYAEMDEERVVIRNVRQARWHSSTDKAIHHQDWSFRWDELQGVDFIVVPFQVAPALAHTMLSFRLRDDRAFVVSVEARLEQHESYSPLAGAARQFEIMYVIGDEQDLLGLRAVVRNDDIYLYPTVATPEQTQLLLKDVLQRTNAIAATPEYYDTLTNNCTTNIIDHVFHLRGNSAASMRLRDQWRSRFPGTADRMAFDMGLLAGDISFEELKAQAWISGRVRQHSGQENLSWLIRSDSKRRSQQL